METLQFATELMKKYVMVVTVKITINHYWKTKTKNWLKDQK